jgi:hypothetical protein
MPHLRQTGDEMYLMLERHGSQIPWDCALIMSLSQIRHLGGKKKSKKALKNCTIIYL